MGEVKKTHQALYRTHRPKSLKEVVGQEHVTTTLANAIRHGRISHAYLFTGPRGVGKTSIARILAHEVNNLPYADDATHLDIIEIDAASNRRIDDIRDLREKVNIAPLSAKYKVYIIDEVHMLTTESFNALLKTLEEPPAHVIFILATTEVHKLPATIISRTQRHTFHSVAVEDIAGHLRTIAATESIDIDDEALALIAERGDGSFRDSISLLDQLSGIKEKITVSTIENLLGIAPRALLAELVEALNAGDPAKTLELIDRMAHQGLTIGGIADQLTQFLRSQLVNGKGNHAMVELMQALATINTATFTKLGLEAALLKYCFTQKETQPQQITDSGKKQVVTNHETHKPPTIVATQPTKKSEPVEVNRSTEDKESTETVSKPQNRKKPINTTQPAGTKSPDEIIKHWQTIIAEVKTQNNSLYTVLRLAKPRIADQTLELAFRFPFHQKRVDDSKNKALIASIIAQQYAAVPEIVTVVDTTIVNEPALSSSTQDDIAIQPAPELEVADSAQGSLIHSVRDIMGGGEVINVQ